MDTLKDHFDEIYRKYQSIMERTARGLLVEKDYAEDLVHDAFVTVLEKYEDLEDGPYLQYLLLKVLKNKINNYNNRFRNFREVAFSPEHEPPTEDTYGNPFRESLPKGLSEEEIELLSLAFEYEYNYKEIGARLGCSAAAAGMRLLRAKLHYRKLLEIEEQKKTAGEAAHKNPNENSDESCYDSDDTTNLEDRRCSDA